MAMNQDQFDCVSERSFNSSILHNASSVSVRDWRTYGSRTDSRLDFSTRTSSSSHYLASSSTNRSHMIVALTEGRGEAKGEIGLAAMDLIGSTLYLYQFPDGYSYSHLLTKLEIIDPCEMLMPSSMCDGGNTRIMEMLLNFKPDLVITKIERRFFNEEDGLKFVRNICHSEYLNKLEVETKEKYYCLSAAAALVRYMECCKNGVFALNSTKILYGGSESTISIDSITAKALEIIVNQETGKSEYTLFSFLNFTKTKVGFRLLRATLREPLADRKTIETRYDLVSELVASANMQYGISDILSKLPDLESIISFVITKQKSVDWKIGERKIEVLIFLKHALGFIKPLTDFLSRAEHPVFQSFNDKLRDANFAEIFDLINESIDPACKLVNGALNIKNQKVFAIKIGQNGLLDSKRQVYSSVLDKLSRIADRMSERFGVAIKLAYNNFRGYHLVATTDKKVDHFTPPPEFIRISHKSKTLTFTTEEVMRANGILNQALEDIFRLSRELLMDVFNQIREKIGCLHKFTEIIALLDLLTSLAWASSKYNMFKPVLGQLTAIKKGYHPFLLIEQTRDLVAPNDAWVTENSNIWILRGPNMSGKSTFMKMVCLQQILAQCGSFVPAEKATFKIVDKILTRLGCDDEIETNSSSFCKEVKGVQYILENFTNKSLIVIDEFGRGTAYEEGLALCWTILERFVGTNAYVFCATHYSLLSQMDLIYPEVTSHFFKSNHQISDDSSLPDLYGLKVAEKSDLPRSLIEKAFEKAQRMEDKFSNWELDLSGKEKRVKFMIGRHLNILAMKPSMNVELLRIYLRNLRKAYQDEIQNFSSKRVYEE